MLVEINPKRNPFYDTMRIYTDLTLKCNHEYDLYSPPSSLNTRPSSPPYSTTSQTNSKHSLVILTPSSTTFFGNAKLCPFSPFPFLTSSAFAYLPVLEPLGIVLEADEARESSVSDFMSERTRDMRAGKVVQSPERRRERAWFWIRVGQFWGEALRAWRRVSWILGYGLALRF